MYHTQKEVHLLIVCFFLDGLTSFVQDADIFIVNSSFPYVIPIDRCSHDNKGVDKVSENASIPRRGNDDICLKCACF